MTNFFALIHQHQIRFSGLGGNRAALSDAVSVNISTGLNGNGVVRRIADELCRFGHKQVINQCFAFQNAVKLQIIGLDLSIDTAFDADNQLVAGNIAFDLTVNMNNAVA